MEIVCDKRIVLTTGKAEVGNSLESGSLRPAWTTESCVKCGDWEMAALPGSLLKRTQRVSPGTSLVFSAHHAGPIVSRGRCC